MNPADHQVELSVIDAVYEDHARVLTPGGGPFAEDRGEVAHVVGDEDPFLGRRQGQHVVVVEPLQRRLLIQRSDLVPGHRQSLSNTRTGDVRVEQEPHRE